MVLCMVRPLRCVLEKFLLTLLRIGKRSMERRNYGISQQTLLFNDYFPGLVVKIQV